MHLKPENFNKYLISLINATKDNEEAYLRIFEAIQPFIIKHGTQILKDYNLSIETMEDHIQNLYMEITKCIDKFDTSMNTKFTFYVTRCIRNYFYNYANHEIKKVKNEVSLFAPANDETDQVIGDTLKSSNKSIENMIIDEEQRMELKKCISKLSLREKRLIQLKYVEKRRYSQISAELGISYQTARNIHKRILVKLNELKMTV